MFKIPFNKPFIVGKELYYIAQAVLNGKIAGDGDFTKKCQTLLEKKFKSDKILLTHSCTAALEMAAILSDVGPDDEVIMPSFTFVSTANAFYLRKAKIVFADINSDTLNIDVQQIERLLTNKTKAIVPVHYAGIPCEMEEIMSISRKHNLIVIEDAAQGVGARYKNRFLGTIGDFGTYSFHETKNVISGEGGALSVNDPAFYERAEVIREKGTNRSQFFKGEVDKYTWVDIGSSYLPSDLIAAFLYSQLENMEKIKNKRSEIFDFYYNELNPLRNEGKISLPYISSKCESNSHMFYILLENEKIRNSMMNFLKSKSILAVFHFLPLHLSPVGLSMGYKDNQFPITESISGRLLRLPFYYELTRPEQSEIVEAINAFFKK